VLLVEDILKQPFRFSCTDSLAEQPIRVISWSDCLCPTHGRFNMLKGQIRRLTADGSGHTKLSLGDRARFVVRLTKTADFGLVCLGLNMFIRSSIVEFGV